jgi:hypothetical protein
MMLTSACAVLAAAGCAAQPASTRALTIAATGHSAAGDPASGQTASGQAASGQAASTPTPRQRAVAEAARLLAAFIRPPGAARVAKPPAVARQALAAPAVSIASATLVDQVAFWVAPGSPQALLAWEAARLPRPFTLGASGSSSRPPAWGDEFSLAPAGVLTARDLVVSVTSAGHDRTAIRVDGQVTWQPTRPRSEVVPASARLVTLAEVPGGNPNPALPPPVTVSGLAAVKKIAALADGLPLSTAGTEPCPLSPGNELQLTFRARAGGRPLAVAEGPGACSTLQFSVNGKQQPALAISGSFIADVLAAAGVHWTGVG